MKVICLMYGDLVKAAACSGQQQMSCHKNVRLAYRTSENYKPEQVLDHGRKLEGSS